MASACAEALRYNRPRLARRHHYADFPDWEPLFRACQSMGAGKNDAVSTNGLGLLNKPRVAFSQDGAPKVTSRSR